MTNLKIANNGRQTLMTKTVEVQVESGAVVVDFDSTDITVKLRAVVYANGEVDILSAVVDMSPDDVACLSECAVDVARDQGIVFSKPEDHDWNR